MMTNEIVYHVASATGAQLLRCRRDSVEPSPYALNALAVCPPYMLFEVERELRLTGGKVSREVKLRYHKPKTGRGD
jgi:hypothetical protein